MAKFKNMIHFVAMVTYFKGTVPHNCLHFVLEEVVMFMNPSSILIYKAALKLNKHSKTGICSLFTLNKPLYNVQFRNELYKLMPKCVLFYFLYQMMAFERKYEFQHKFSFLQTKMIGKSSELPI